MRLSHLLDYNLSILVTILALQYGSIHTKFLALSSIPYISNQWHFP